MTNRPAPDRLQRQVQRHLTQLEPEPLAVRAHRQVVQLGVRGTKSPLGLILLSFVFGGIELLLPWRCIELWRRL